MDTNNATKIVEALDAGALRQRLEQLSGEEDALRVLLRAAVLRDRRQAKSQQQPAAKGGHS
jgi:hypothetical protein